MITEVERLIDNVTVEYFQNDEYKIAPIQFEQGYGEYFVYQDENGMNRRHKLEPEEEEEQLFAQGELDENYYSWENHTNFED